MDVAIKTEISLIAGAFHYNVSQIGDVAEIEAENYLQPLNLI